MARLNMPAGPGGEAAMIWTLRPQLGGMVERMDPRRLPAERRGARAARACAIDL